MYESACKQAGTSPRQFSQSEATWMPSVDMWMGPTEQLEAEGIGRLKNLWLSRQHFWQIV